MSGTPPDPGIVWEGTVAGVRCAVVRRGEELFVRRNGVFTPSLVQQIEVLKAAVGALTAKQG